MQRAVNDPIETLGLNVRAFNSLRRSGIITVGDLWQAIEDGSVMYIRNFGPQSLREVRGVLEHVAIVGDLPITTAKTTTSPDQDTVRLASEKAVRDALLPVLDWHVTAIREQVAAYLLHEDALLDGARVGSLLVSARIDNPLITLHHFSSIVSGPLNVATEIRTLLDSTVLRPVDQLVFDNRYGLKPKTLQEIADAAKLTRERVRQISVRHAKRMLDCIAAKQLRLLRIQTALLIARDQGDNLTFRDWLMFLSECGILGRWEGRSPHQIVCDLLAVCSALHEEIPYLTIPDNLHHAIELEIEGQGHESVRQQAILRSIPTDLRRLMRRFSHNIGCVSSSWLSRESSMDHNEVCATLSALGFDMLESDWYLTKDTSSEYCASCGDVFHRCLRKMSQYCGPLRLEDICSGLRHMTSKTNFPVPPPKVVSFVLADYGYIQEDGLWYWPGECEETISRSERVILDCMRTQGPVVHHSQLCEALLVSGLSLPTLHATFRNSPLFVKITTALYGLRGTKITASDIERAERTAVRTATDFTVSYSAQGKLLLGLNVGVLPIMTGTVYNERLPNLEGEWPCRVQEKMLGNVVITQSEIRGLGAALEAIQCIVGGRVELAFDMWDRYVEVSRVQEA